jgi:hypothetical protein
LIQYYTKILKTDDPPGPDDPPGLTAAQKQMVRDSYRGVFAALVSLFDSQVSSAEITSFDNNFSLWGDTSYNDNKLTVKMDIMGNVNILGMVRTPSGVGLGADQTICSVPDAYKPAAGSNVIFPAVSNNNFAALEIRSDGKLVFRGTPTADAWVAVNITYRLGS